jgi:hypothetical protein
LWSGIVSIVYFHVLKPFFSLSQNNSMAASIVNIIYILPANKIDT